MAIQLTNPMNGDVFKAELEKALDKTGDTMSGSLILAKNPTDDMEAATKEYVDSLWNFIPGNTLIYKNTQYVFTNGVNLNVSQENEIVLFKFNPRASGILTLNINVPLNMCFSDINFSYSKYHGMEVIGNADIEITYGTEEDEISLYSLINHSIHCFIYRYDSSTRRVNPNIISNYIASVNINVKKDVSATIKLKITPKDLKLQRYTTVDLHYTDGILTGLGDDKYGDIVNLTKTALYYNTGTTDTEASISLGVGNPLFIIEEVEI